MSAPATAGAGATIAITETTLNQGGGSAGTSATRFYLSANFSLDANDTPLGSRAVPTLAASGSSSATTTVSIRRERRLVSDHLIANADDGNAVAEPVETNNVKYVFIRVGPDLVVSSIVAPARAGSGGHCHHRHDGERGGRQCRRLDDDVLLLVELRARRKRHPADAIPCGAGPCAGRLEHHVDHGLRSGSAAWPVVSDRQCRRWSAGWRDGRNQQRQVRDHPCRAGLDRLVDSRAVVRDGRFDHQRHRRRP